MEGKKKKWKYLVQVPDIWKVLNKCVKRATKIVENQKYNDFLLCKNYKPQSPHHIY